VIFIGCLLQLMCHQNLLVCLLKLPAGNTIPGAPQVEYKSTPFFTGGKLIAINWLKRSGQFNL
jgi:hypothetical protein